MAEKAATFEVISTIATMFNYLIQQQAQMSREEIEASVTPVQTKVTH